MQQAKLIHSMKFSEININANIQKAISELNFVHPTPIQEKVIPYLIKNEQDIIALAQTGTGKTAAFGIPMIQKIDVKKMFPQAIVLCPTRELCLQITKDINAYAKYTKNLKTTSVYGGANIQTQIKDIKAGSHIIIGTPGRVIDLIKRKVLKLNNIQRLILDEADEMLNMGFKDDLDTILAETPTTKQTLLFSATMPKEVMRISKNYMSKAEEFKVASRNEGAENIEHFYYMVNARDRYQALRRICDINPNIYGIVFCRTRRETKDVADKLMHDGYNADALHGDLSQAQRDHVMQKFRKKNIQMLIATDVAARGIDINELTHVINYNLPDDNEVYVHRSGRTGRAGNKGISIIIAHSREGRKINAIEKMIKKKITAKKVPNGNEICQIQLMNLVENVVNSQVNIQIEDYLPSIQEKLAHLNKEELIKHFISVEFNRFLLFYRNAKDLNINHNKERKDNSKSKNKKGRAEKGYTRFYINIGSNRNLQTHNLIGLINEYTKNRNIPVGKIDIMKRFSFFEVASDFEKIILTSFNKATWNKNNLIVEKSEVPGKQKNKKIKQNQRQFSKKKKNIKSKKRKTKIEGKSFKEKFRKL